MFCNTDPKNLVPVNGTARLYVVQTKSYKGQLLKGNQIYDKNSVILKSVSSFTLSAMFRNTFLLNETYFSVVICLQWHHKLQYLFCSDLYNQWKSKKCADPLTQQVGELK
jgi:hypothetical protein